MRLFHAISVGLCSLLVGLDACRAQGPAPTPSQRDFFEKSVRPVLATNCFKCHGESKPKAGLRLDSRSGMLVGGQTGPAIVPGHPEQSLLITAIRYEDTLRMPPKHKLKDDDIAALVSWVKQGALWPADPATARLTASRAARVTDKDRQFWAFQPTTQPALPAIQDCSWPQSSIDYFVLTKLEANGLHPVERADRRTLLRRVTFDLIGLPPTEEEIDAFLKDDRPDAYARVVDRLLASPHYGERWGRHWLDVARYGEDQAHTFQAQLYPAGFRYRDWVVGAFNKDLPYDEFIREQIAADLLDGPGLDERLPALGFFACGPVYYGDRKKFDQLDDRIDTLTRGFLGLTVACARCHDHKFDPIPTQDYYALAGVFASTDYAEKPLAPPAAVDGYQKAVAALERQRKAIDQFLGTEKAQLAKAAGAKGAAQKSRNKLEDQLSAEARKKLAAMRAELESLKKKVPDKYPVVHALKDNAHPADIRVCLRGNPQNLGEVVRRHFLSVLDRDTKPFTSGSGRLELARDIASKDNPLTARVLVNRVWQHHFGKGLVGTPSNFGALGERPTHPELLDHLAERFIASGWSIKALHRLILLSATYQLSSRWDAVNGQKDPESRLLWRVNPRRLEVEPWRDAMLAVSGRLDGRLGGPSVDLSAPANQRRTVYAAISRHSLNSLLRLFDFPDPNITNDARTVTTVPLQQLFVLNSTFVVDNARALAARLTARQDEDDAARVRRAFLLLYGRPATATEVHDIVNYLQPAQSSRQDSLSRWERVAQALLSADEFLFID
jgi:Protein of unknown function (DUF1553)/Protein of unknown function (DUF1549)/Planctomycete cytochrome C